MLCACYNFVYVYLRDEHVQEFVVNNVLQLKVVLLEVQWEEYISQPPEV